MTDPKTLAEQVVREREACHPDSPCYNPSQWQSFALAAIEARDKEWREFLQTYRDHYAGEPLFSRDKESFPRIMQAIDAMLVHAPKPTNP